MTAEELIDLHRPWIEYMSRNRHYVEVVYRPGTPVAVLVAPIPQELWDAAQGC